MQSKGIVVVTAVLLTPASISYLSLSTATRYCDGQATKLKDPIAQQEYKDSAKYLGIYSYQRCLETQIRLGLDLGGGMNVVLEISVPDVVEMLVDHKTDAAFMKLIEEVRAEEETSQEDSISLFIEAYRKNAPGHKLAEIFAAQQLQSKVDPQSTDAEAEKALHQEAQSAIGNSFNVVHTRIDQFGVVQPDIQELEGQQGHIMVKMPGVCESERMHKLSQDNVNLKFWETFSAEEITPYLTQIDACLTNDDTQVAGTTSVDTTATKAVERTNEEKVVKKADPKFQLKRDKKQSDVRVPSEEQITATKKEHPLLTILSTTRCNALNLAGYASIRDTAEINKIIHPDLVRQILPADLELFQSARPADGPQMKNYYELHALRIITITGRTSLKGDMIVDVPDQFDHLSGKPEVSMTTNTDDTRR